MMGSMDEMMDLIRANDAKGLRRALTSDLIQKSRRSTCSRLLSYSVMFDSHDCIRLLLEFRADPLLGNNVSL